MLSSASASRSVGCHVSPGNARLYHTACSPVPLAISKTDAGRGKTPRSTRRIGSRLRAAAGAVRAPGFVRAGGVIIQIGSLALSLRAPYFTPCVRDTPPGASAWGWAGHDVDFQGSCGVACWCRTLLSRGHAADSKIIKRTRSNAVLARSYADRGNVNDSVPGMDWCFFDMCARNMLFGSDQGMSSAPRNSARTP
jgi:hypothetical protein